MLQPRLDLSRHVGGDEKDEGGQHQDDRHPPRPAGRRPDRNERRVREAVDEQDEARDRQQREEHLVAGLAQPADQRRAQARVRRQSVNAEKDDDADDEKRHVPGLKQ